MIDKQLISKNFSNKAKDYTKLSFVQKRARSELFLFSNTLNSYKKTTKTNKKYQKKIKFLDLGCATGDILNDLTNLDYFGIDIANGMLDIAKKNYPNAFFLCADLEEIKLAKNHYDIAFSNFSLHWLIDLQRFLTKILNSLKPKAKFIFSLVLNESFFELTSSFKKLNLQKRTNDFTSFVNLKKVLEQNYQNKIKLKKVILKEEFCSLFSLLKSFKNIGAQTSDQEKRILTRKNIKDLQNIYPKNKNHKLPLSWEIALVEIQK